MDVGSTEDIVGSTSLVIVIVVLLSVVNRLVGIVKMHRLMP